MPRSSIRQTTLRDIDKLLELAILFSDSDDEAEEDIEDLIALRGQIESMRSIVPSTPIPKDSGLREMLWQYPEPSFRQIVRMDKSSIVRLLHMIQYLSRLGCNGNGAAIGWYARMAGVSHGSVCKYTSRVFTAILDLHDPTIFWPSIEERRDISRRFASRYGIPGAVGIVDGTHGTETFLLADSGYAGKPFICTPYKNPQALIPHHQLFNKLFSSARVLIEYLNGILKARFSSLRGLRTQVKKKKDYDRIYKCIVVCLILHNFTVKFNDKAWPELEDIYEENNAQMSAINVVENGNQ